MEDYNYMKNLQIYLLLRKAKLPLNFSDRHKDEQDKNIWNYRVNLLLKIHLFSKKNIYDFDQFAIFALV